MITKNITTQILNRDKKALLELRLWPNGITVYISPLQVLLEIVYNFGLIILVSFITVLDITGYLIFHDPSFIGIQIIFLVYLLYFKIIYLLKEFKILKRVKLYQNLAFKKFTSGFNNKNLSLKRATKIEMSALFWDIPVKTLLDKAGKGLW